MASMLPRTLKVTAAVNRLPNGCDAVLKYQTLNGPFTVKLEVVVSSLMSLFAGSTKGVNVKSIVFMDRVGE
jgi:hypothetical protein